MGGGDELPGSIDLGAQRIAARTIEGDPVTRIRPLRRVGGPDRPGTRLAHAGSLQDLIMGSGARGAVAAPP